MRLLGEDPAHRLEGCSVCTYSLLFTGCLNGCSVCTYSPYVIYRVSDGCSACTYSPYIIDRVSRQVLGLYLLTVCYLQGVQIGAQSVLTHRMLLTGCRDRCSACTYSPYVIDRVSGQVLSLYFLAACYLQGVRTGARPVLTRPPLVTRFARMDSVTLGTLRTRTTTGSSVSVRKRFTNFLVASKRYLFKGCFKNYRPKIEVWVS